MDMQSVLEEAAESGVDPREEYNSGMELSEEMIEQIREIREACLTVPVEVQEALWPNFEKDVTELDPSMMGGSQLPNVETLQANAGEPGMVRVQLKVSLFRDLDRDKDGVLYADEMHEFASTLLEKDWNREFLFEVDDDDLWYEEYRDICEIASCMPEEGVDVKGFSHLLDEMKLTNENIADLVGYSAALPRAGR